MALYVLADLHLPFGNDKPMDIFGGAWTGYTEKLRSSLSVLREEDTIVFPGDICWAMSLSSAVPDFAFLNSYPGKKLIIKGNHDYWWTTATKFKAFCDCNGFRDFAVINNNCFFYGETALCGTRGWFFEEERGTEHDGKVFRRELMRLETSLKAAGSAPKICFLHYPPRYRGYECPEILAMLRSYGVKDCYYGHLHGGSHKLAIEGDAGGVQLHLTAADYLDFRPLKILD